MAPLRSGVQYLPNSLVQELLWTAFTEEQRAAMDEDHRWRMARLVESAFGQGHHEGYMRARQEESAARANAKPEPSPAPAELLDAVKALSRLPVPSTVTTEWPVLSAAINRVVRGAEVTP